MTRGRRFVLTTFFRAKKYDRARCLLALCSCSLLATGSAAAQDRRKRAHGRLPGLEPRQGQLVVRNEMQPADRRMLFMALDDQHVVQAEVAPGAWFDTGRRCGRGRRLHVHRLPGRVRAERALRRREQDRRSWTASTTANPRAPA